MIELTGEDLTIEQLVEIARNGTRVAPLNDTVSAQMQRTHEWVLQLIHGQGKTLYGVNTGFGSLASVQIAPEEARQLSRNLVLTCVTGVGQPLDKDVVRAMMVIRANMLATGHSGVRPLVAQTLINMLNADVTPYVPSKGSLGASGDLAPLAHIAVVMTRDQGDGGGFSGQAWLGNKLMEGAQAMSQAGIERLHLEAKEGIGLTNGLDFMIGAGALALYDAQNLLRHAEIGAALSLEALLGISAAFHPAIQTACRQPGHRKVAQDLRTLTLDSQLIDSVPEKVQDAYSLRCIPQVLGPIHDTLAFLRDRFSLAVNAITDNPLIFPAGSEYMAISGGNFHGQGPAMWLDFLGIALAEAGSIAERRIFRMLTPELNSGLPSMLVPSSGLDSGLMMIQYTAAALVSDNKTLAHPDSVDSIPSCANQEDHVSMGANAARHALEILENVSYILAIELMAASQAIELRPNGLRQLGRGTAAAFPLIRERVSFLKQDRAMTQDIEALVELIRTEKLIEAVQSAVRIEL